jgi:hypothetical protein
MPTIATQLSDYKKHAGISRTVSGQENFTATIFLAIADALGLAVTLVPKEAVQTLQIDPRLCLFAAW